MLAPAAVYLLLSDDGRGWGIPLATDMALALGVLTVVAPRAPGSLRLFLLTVALLDIIGSIVVIAVFYSDGVVLEWALVGVAIVLLIAVLRLLPSSSLAPYLVLGIALWIALDQSGIYPAITGVVVGFLMPALPRRRESTASQEARWAVREATLQIDTAEGASPYWLIVSETSRRAVSPLARVEGVLHPWSTRVIMPTFALANGGVELNAEALDLVASPVGGGIVAGLVIGKPLGVAGGVWIARRLGLGRLPDGVSIRMLVGTAALAGVGFVIALLTTEVAFDDSSSTNGAKLAVLVASLMAVAVGALILRFQDTTGDRSLSKIGGVNEGPTSQHGSKEDD